MDYKKNIVDDKVSIKKVLKLLNSLNHKTLFIVNENNKLIGSLTDGDIRRGLLKDRSIEDSIVDFIQTNYSFLIENELSPKKFHELKNKDIALVPVLNENKEIKDLINIKNHKSLLPVDAVIMAGGLGTRLRPLTNETPKPMLKVGDKPIIEHNLNLLKSYGITNIGISVNYLADKIIEHYQNGKERGLKITYLKEKEPLGTLGSAKLMKNIQNDYLLVMNSDLLTTINLEEMYNQLIQHKGDLIAASTEYEVKVPYGIIETNDGFITAIKEKPTYSYYSNAGIYLFKKEVLSKVPENRSYNATDLIQSLLDDKKKVLNFPIRGYWLDIGKMNDFEKAQKDIDQLDLK